MEIAENVLKLANDDKCGGPRREFLGAGDSSGIRRASVKLDFSKFTGEDPEGWLYLADEYFTSMELGKSRKCSWSDFI